MINQNAHAFFASRLVKADQMPSSFQTSHPTINRIVGKVLTTPANHRVCLRCRIERQPYCALCAAWTGAKYPTDARLKYASSNRSYLETR